MEKAYTHSVAFKAITLVCMAIGTLGAFISEAIVLKLITLLCFGWVAIFILRLRILVTDNCLVKDVGRLMRRTESNWDQIIRISQVPSAFLMTYKIQCAGQSSIMIPDTMDTYIDLLREIIERSPNAIVEDSVRELLEKKKKK